MKYWFRLYNSNYLFSVNYEHVGQNLGFINSSVADFDIQKSIRLLVNLWYEEVEIFQSEWVNVTEDR